MGIRGLIIITLGLVLFTGCSDSYSSDLPRATTKETAAEAWYMARKALVIAQENKEAIEEMRNR